MCLRLFWLVFLFVVQVLTCWLLCLSFPSVPPPLSPAQSGCTSGSWCPLLSAAPSPFQALGPPSDKKWNTLDKLSYNLSTQPAIAKLLMKFVNEENWNISIDIFIQIVILRINKIFMTYTCQIVCFVNLCKPLTSCSRNPSKITARNERFLSGFLSKIWAVWAVFPKKTPKPPKPLKPLKPLKSCWKTAQTAHILSGFWAGSRPGRR